MNPLFVCQTLKQLILRLAFSVHKCTSHITQDCSDVLPSFVFTIVDSASSAPCPIRIDMLVKLIPKYNSRPSAVLNHFRDCFLRALLAANMHYISLSDHDPEEEEKN